MYQNSVSSIDYLYIINLKSHLLLTSHTYTYTQVPFISIAHCHPIKSQVPLKVTDIVDSQYHCIIVMFSNTAIRWVTHNSPFTILPDSLTFLSLCFDIRGDSLCGSRDVLYRHDLSGVGASWGCFLERWLEVLNVRRAAGKGLVLKRWRCYWVEHVWREQKIVHYSAIKMVGNQVYREGLRNT